MLDVFVTIDTELSPGGYRSGWGSDLVENFVRTIACRTPNEPLVESGIFYQMALMNDYGVRGVFFVDPMASLVWGQRAVDMIVEPILEHGHEVQLHCHTEWLEFAPDNPLKVGTGHHLKNFPISEQLAILQYAAERLAAAGAPSPAAFRAGNYGANDDTLRALAQLGIGMDSSFAAGLPAPCEISLPAGSCAPSEHCGVLELPISAIGARNGALRHAQITSLSSAEMIAAMVHAENYSWEAFVMVSHSFELYDRNRCKVNPIIRKRFENICRFLGENMDTIQTPSTDAWHPKNAAEAHYTTLPQNTFRTARRVVEQAIVNTLHA